MNHLLPAPPGRVRAVAKSIRLSPIWLAILTACQGGGPADVPAEVRAAAIRRCAEIGVDAGQVDRARGLFKPVDLTPQAAPDWLVDFNAAPSGQLCGTGGCPLQVWVKIGAAPYHLAFDRRVLGHAIGRHGSGRRWLDVDLHGARCGETGSEPCRYHFEWHGNADVATGYFAAASIWGQPARYAGPLVQPLPVTAPVGSGVATALARFRAACAAAGGDADLSEALARLPDLNRDGHPEWLFDAGQALCLRDDEPIAPRCADEDCHSRLFVVDSQGWRSAWSGAAFAYTVDYSRPDPRLLVRPADCAPDCPERALLWRDAERRFGLAP